MGQLIVTATSSLEHMGMMPCPLCWYWLVACHYQMQLMAWLLGTQPKSLATWQRACDNIMPEGEELHADMSTQSTLLHMEGTPLMWPPLLMAHDMQPVQPTCFSSACVTRMGPKVLREKVSLSVLGVMSGMP